MLNNRAQRIMARKNNANQIIAITTQGQTTDDSGKKCLSVLVEFADGRTATGWRYDDGTVVYEDGTLNRWCTWNSPALLAYNDRPDIVEVVGTLLRGIYDARKTYIEKYETDMYGVEMVGDQLTGGKSLANIKKMLEAKGIEWPRLTSKGSNGSTPKAKGKWPLADKSDEDLHNMARQAVEKAVEKTDPMLWGFIDMEGAISRHEFTLRDQREEQRTARAAAQAEADAKAAEEKAQREAEKQAKADEKATAKLETIMGGMSASALQALAARLMLQMAEQAKADNAEAGL